MSIPNPFGWTRAKTADSSSPWREIEDLLSFKVCYLKYRALCSNDDRDPVKLHLPAILGKTADHGCQ